jgi:hypothetical protein
MARSGLLSNGFLQARAASLRLRGRGSCGLETERGSLAHAQTQRRPQNWHPLGTRGRVRDSVSTTKKASFSGAFLFGGRSKHRPAAQSGAGRGMRRPWPPHNVRRSISPNSQQMNKKRALVAAPFIEELLWQPRRGNRRKRTLMRDRRS